MITDNAKNILIADDSQFFRTKLSEILTEAGHNVIFARNGSEVIKDIAKMPDDIDLLILDLQMPDIDGFEVLKWINENGFKDVVRTLVITGVYEPANIVERLRSLGAAGLMTKGFTPEEIIFRVNRLLFQEKTTRGGANERVPVSIPVDFVIGDATHTGFLLNISETGTYLHTKYELLAGTVMHLKFTLPGSVKVMDIKGIVRWATTDIASRAFFGGGGVMFTTVEAGDQELLREFVDSELRRLELEE